MSTQTHTPYETRHFTRSAPIASEDLDSGQAELLSSPPLDDDPRHAKRRRVTATLRTAIACRACRDRKTRCSGDQPTCKYCSKTGIACEYNSSAVAQPFATPPSKSLDEWGQKILEAVDSVAQELRDKEGVSQRIPRIRDEDHTYQESEASDSDEGLMLSNSDDERHDAFANPSLRRQPQERRSISSNSRSRPPGSTIRLHGPTLITSSLSILQWPIFSESERGGPTQQVKSTRLALCKQRNSDQHALESANCGTTDLNALLTCFEEALLPSMPVIDIVHTRRLIRSTMADCSVPWTSEACLILLISALGSIHRPKTRRDSHGLSQDDTSYLSSPTSSRPLSIPATCERISPTAVRYWNMARKRLMWAINTTGRLSAQCQLLAGVYLIYSSEPAAAWKMLYGALVSIEESESTRTDERLGAEPNSSLDQQIRMASFSLMCRLRSEIEIPHAPVFLWCNMGDRLVSPTDTQHRSALVPNRIFIDILQLRARAYANASLTRPDLSTRELHRLQSRISTLLTALENWQTSLPGHWPLFDDPNDRCGSPVEDHHTWLRLQILYLESQELILRPSLFLALHSEAITDAAPPSAGADTDSFGDVLARHVSTQLRSMALRHRTSLLLRARSCLAIKTEQPTVPEIGWLKRQTYSTLGLLLIASSQLSLSASGAEPSEIESAISQLLEFLEHDRICTAESRIFANILRAWRQSATQAR